VKYEYKPNDYLQKMQIWGLGLAEFTYSHLKPTSGLSLLQETQNFEKRLHKAVSLRFLTAVGLSKKS
jgi:hypothetical protein